MILWLLIGVILLAVIWALISAAGHKAPAKSESYQDTQSVPEYEDPIPTPKAHSWTEGSKTTVSKSFGKGGDPTGVATDAGGMASNKNEEDWLKNAKPFEPRATNLNLDPSADEELETV